ncbi:MAG: thiamine pyrophosphate-dependent dehydrogenase E1 component subunit alpha [Methanobacteriota archaeon]
MAAKRRTEDRTEGGPEPPYSVLRDDGSVEKAHEPELPDADLLSIYETMVLVRTLDARMMNLQRQGRIGFYGTTTGEEAAVVGSGVAFRPTDWVFPALRQGGILLHRGFPLEKYVAHLFGNDLSVERGRSMPCHYSDRAYHQVSWSSSMATQLPHAVGAAYASRYLGQDTVMAAYLGDGATSESDFHVAMNFAGVWKAPVVFVCQNNQWAISVPFSKQTASKDVAAKARAYGFPGWKVDGNDVLAVYGATKAAVDRARAGEGPTLLEAVTYRMGGHSSSDDPTRYRSADEVEAWGRRDPIPRFERYLARRGLFSPSVRESLEGKLNDRIGAAIEKAEAAPAPPARTLIEDVYAEVPWHLAEEFEAAGSDE